MSEVCNFDCPCDEAPKDGCKCFCHPTFVRAALEQAERSRREGQGLLDHSTGLRRRAVLAMPAGTILHWVAGGGSVVVDHHGTWHTGDGLHLVVSTDDVIHYFTTGGLTWRDPE